MIFPMAYLPETGIETTLARFSLFHDGRQIQAGVPPGAENAFPNTPTGRIKFILGQVPNGIIEMSYHADTIPLDADAYVFQLGSPGWVLEMAQLLKRQNPTAKFLLDMDDDLHRVPKYNPAVLDKLRSPDNNRRNAQEMLEFCDGASFSTPALADFYKRWQPNVRVIPNYLHWPMWADLPPVYERREWRNFRVGYMGNTDFHAADLQTIAAPLSRWLHAHPDAEFVAAGDPRIHDLIGVPEKQRVSTSLCFFRALDLPYITSCMDVGLVPLARNAFNEGKSCLKGMELAACGIPVIASPTAEYQRWIGDEEPGWLAASPRQFIECLDYAYEDRAALETKARAAYSAARSASLDRRIFEWADWLHSFSDEKAVAA